MIRQTSLKIDYEDAFIKTVSNEELTIQLITEAIEARNWWDEDEGIALAWNPRLNNFKDATNDAGIFKFSVPGYLLEDWDLDENPKSIQAICNELSCQLDSLIREHTLILLSDDLEPKDMVKVMPEELSDKMLIEYAIWADDFDKDGGIMAKEIRERGLLIQLLKTQFGLGQYLISGSITLDLAAEDPATTLLAIEKYAKDKTDNITILGTKIDSYYDLSKKVPKEIIQRFVDNGYIILEKALLYYN